MFLRSLNLILIDLDFCFKKNFNLIGVLNLNLCGNLKLFKYWLILNFVSI